MLSDLIKQHLTPETTQLFDNMLSADQANQERTYLLTQLKRAHELMKTTAIKAIINDQKYLKTIYT